jgi:hypothetical protein
MYTFFSFIFLLSVDPGGINKIIPPVGRMGIRAIRYYHSDSIPHSILIASIVDGIPKTRSAYQCISPIRGTHHLISLHRL